MGEWLFCVNISSVVTAADMGIAAGSSCGSIQCQQVLSVDLSRVWPHGIK